MRADRASNPEPAIRRPLPWLRRWLGVFLVVLANVAPALAADRPTSLAIMPTSRREPARRRRPIHFEVRYRQPRRPAAGSRECRDRREPHAMSSADTSWKTGASLHWSSKLRGRDP